MDHPPARVFLSHVSQNSALAVAIAASLRKSVPGGVYCYENSVKPAYFDELNRELARCTHMVALIGDVASAHQANEVRSFYDTHQTPSSWRLVDCRKEPAKELPERFGMLQGCTKLDCPPGDAGRGGRELAKQLARSLRFPWRDSDDLPANPHLFDYEKDITRFYLKMPPGGDTPEDTLSEEERTAIYNALLDGVPPEWPEVRTISPSGREEQNPDSLKEIVGEWRRPDAMVVAAALSDYHLSNSDGCVRGKCLMKTRVGFPEAGPRQRRVFPRHGNALNVGVLVSGGIAPGINAVIDGITRRHKLYAEHNRYIVNVKGLLDGFLAFNQADTAVFLVPDRHHWTDSRTLVTGDYANAGGSMLGTSRVETLVNPPDPERRTKLLENIVTSLYKDPIDILYIIGGDGSMKAAHAIHSYAREYAEREGIQRELSVIGVPKTMDNDILWVWQSFGFLSAVEKGREVIDNLSTEVVSNPRLCVVQLFGSDSGFVVSHAVLASQGGICDAALIPEVPFSMRKLAPWVMQRMAERGKRIPASLVVMAETAIPTDAMDFIGDEDIGLLPKEQEALREFEELRSQGRRILGQTNDWLRSAGLKIVSRGLRKLIAEGGFKVSGTFQIPDWELLRVFTNEPRHLLRAIPPSCTDIIGGQRLGTLAVDNALAGYTDFMISQWLTEYVLVPLKLVVLGRKRIPRYGVFWRSVKAKTGQPPLE